MSPPRKKSPLPDEILDFARGLRAGQTDAENLLWAFLRGRRFLGLKFRRQHPVKPYILDFYCDELQLAIELDGGQHNTDDARRSDGNRTAYLAERQIEVLRFWNHDVLGDLETVLEAIFWKIEKIKQRNTTK